MTWKRSLILWAVLSAPLLCAARPPLATYAIYHDADAPPSVARAAAELQQHLGLATGVQPEIVTEPRSPMIALGESAAARAAGITAGELPWEASRIATRGDDVFIVGRDLPDDGNTPLGGRSFGTLFGAFAFLEEVAGVRWLMPGEHGTHVPRNPGLRVPDLDRIEKPGFEYRKLSGVCTVGNDWYLHQRFDQNLPFDERRPIRNPFPKEGRGGTGGSLEVNSEHAWDVLFPPPGSPRAAYLEDREATYRRLPELFELSADGRRVHPIANFSLCLSHPEADAEVARRVGLVFDHEGARNVSIFPNDAAPRCACERCQARLITPDPRHHVGTHSESAWSAVVFEHFRAVAERVAQTHPGRTVSGGCYYKHEVPYEGVTPLPDNFFGSMAPVRIAYGPLRLDPGYNATWHRLLEAWRPLVPNMVYYGVDFWMRDCSGAPNLPCLEMMRDTFATLRRLDYRGAYFYGNLGYGKSSLVNYLLAKLLWSPERDPEEVFEEFCDAAYGAGARQIKALYTILDSHLAQFVREHIGDPIGYNMYPELLRDVYGSEWSSMEALYLDALAVAAEEGTRWRLERLGDNLKLLHYHLTRLGLVEADTASPLYLEEEQSQVLNGALRLAPWVLPPLNLSPHLRDCLAPVTVDTTHAPLAGAPAPGPFRLQYHQDVLIVPREDGVVTARLLPETSVDPKTGKPWLPDIPYYMLYDLERPEATLAGGIAGEGGTTIRFQGERGRRYLLGLAPTGRYYSGTRYGFEADAPWALGDKIDPKGLRFNRVETPLYFFVPEGTQAFDLFFSGSARAEVLDPAGAVAGGVDSKDYQALSLSAEGRPAGFWTVRFLAPASVCIRQDPALSGYFTVDPSMPLAVSKAVESPSGD